MATVNRFYPVPTLWRHLVQVQVDPWVKIQCPTEHKTGHVWNVLSSQHWL